MTTPIKIIKSILSLIIFIFSNDYFSIVTPVIMQHIAQIPAIDLTHVTQTLILSYPIHKINKIIPPLPWQSLHCSAIFQLSPSGHMVWLMVLPILLKLGNGHITNMTTDVSTCDMCHFEAENFKS